MRKLIDCSATKLHLDSISTAKDIMSHAYRCVVDIEEGFGVRFPIEEKTKLMQSFALVASNDCRTSSLCAISDNVCEALEYLGYSISLLRGDVDE